MKAAAFVTILIAPLLVGACDSILGDDEGEVELSVDGAAFAAGDEVMLRIHNGTDESIFFNTCILQLDVRSGSEWLATGFIGDGPCLAIDPFWPGLASGSSTNESVMIPEDVPAGTYRLRLGVWEEDEASVDFATPAFDVQAPNAAPAE